MKRLLALTPLFLVATSWANENAWQDMGMVIKPTDMQKSIASAITNTTAPAALQQYRRLALNEDNLRSSLNQVSIETNNKQSTAAAGLPTISLPLPDGSFATVTIKPKSILSPKVAAEHPEIQIWQVAGADGKVTGGVIDLNKNGFHAMLNLPNGDTVFIDPQTLDGKREYASFSQRSNSASFKHNCGMHDNESSFRSDLSNPTSTTTNTKPALAEDTGATLHVYDIAISTTGEWTQRVGGEEQAFSAVATLLSRVNSLYESEASIGFELVSDENLIFQDPNTDPYTNGDGLKMLEQNVETVNDVLGKENYDIGHVFATSGGSYGRLASVCDDTQKGGGVTTLGWHSDGNVEAFSVSSFRHELGHQFGATHTFSSCPYQPSEPDTAVEPGGGSTIMSYAGICGSNDLQISQDPMFHSVSLKQILNFAHLGIGLNYGSIGGAVCASKYSLDNVSPVVNAGANYTIPASTPFILTGNASDADNDTLTYSWEQIDPSAAYIRARMPTTSRSRTIPLMANLIKGQKFVLGEQLTTSSRTWNFRLTARDGNGGTGYDDMVVKTKNTGKAFTVTAPAGTLLVPNTTQTILWNVASTDLYPISCSAVDIAITSDKGQTFKTLATKKPNIGSASITLPSTLGSSNYFRVKCSNNIFFALSPNNPKK